MWLLQADPAVGGCRIFQVTTSQMSEHGMSVHEISDASSPESGID